MMPIVKLYLERADNELVLSESLFRISSNALLQQSQLKIEKTTTFYSAVITHAYYSIFYSAKAILLLKGIKTKPPEEHRKTLRAFTGLVKSGFVDKQLLKIYEDVVVKAEVLVDIFALEKKKRGKFTYHKLPQANKQPALESLENAKLFFKSINAIVEQANKKER